MPIKVIVTRDYDHLSEVAAQLVSRKIQATLRRKTEMVLGLPTGSSPTGMYKHLAKAANAGIFDSARLRTFNLDEYIGLPGENAQQRALHPESYSFFMIQEFFGLLHRKIRETNVPAGVLIEQKQLIAELRDHPGDWREVGTDAGKAIVIRVRTKSNYLAWVRRQILLGYEKKIKRSGGVDLQIIGIGGRGHVAFHEAGIPFPGSRVLLVKLDKSTVHNAVSDGHFASVRDCPRYAVSMGAELVYAARMVLLLASGARKTGPVADSLLAEPTPELPVSYGQIYARRGGKLLYLVDQTAGRELLARRHLLPKKSISLQDLSRQKAKTKISALCFHRDPKTHRFG